MSLGRNWVSWFLLVLSLGCLTAALFPQWNEWVDPTNGDRVREHRLGLAFSPLHQTIERLPAQGGFGGFSVRFAYVSWSGLLLVVGLFAGAYACEGFLRRRRIVASNPPNSAVTNSRLGEEPN
jgi:hypothetical protein